MPGHETVTSSRTFERFGGLCAVLAGIAGFLYSVSFVVLARAAPGAGELLSSLLLLLGGLLSTAVFVALFGRLRETDPGFALWGLVLGLLGAAGSAIHGAYLVANVLNPPASNPVTEAGLPQAVDPRGFLTFAVTGIAVLVASSLVVRDRRWPTGLGYLGYASGALLLIVYVARVFILDPASPVVLVPVALLGFIVNPAWLVWLGISLRRGRPVLPDQA